LQISVIIPLLNESESLPELFSWIDKVMVANSFSYEVIAVDDGSTDSSWEVITKESKKNAAIKGIRFQRNYGKSAALNEGFKAAKGQVVITMDADLQDSPEEIPDLYNMITVEKYDLVSGWKKKRFDNAVTKNIPSKFFNWATQSMSGIQLHDFNCGLKAYRIKVVKSIEVYGEMHRYIPVIAKWAGYPKIGEKVVQHQARKYGITKFGWERFVNGFLDLMTISFVTKFGKRPMHLFGFLGAIFFFIGFAISFYLAVEKFAFDEYQMTQRPIFYMALVAMILGTQLFLAGFIGELISRNAPERNVYLIEDQIL
jgi:glycosyltransferase involved in cell wall biosynthesis